MNKLENAIAWVLEHQVGSRLWEERLEREVRAKSLQNFIAIYGSEEGPRRLALARGEYFLKSF